MKKLSLEQMENVEGGKFFGMTHTSGAGWKCKEFFTFWISWGQSCETVGVAT